MQTGALLLRHVQAHAGWYALAAAFIGVANVAQAFFPKVLGEFADHMQAEELSFAGVSDYSLVLLGIGVFYGAAFGVGQYINHRLGRKFEHSARQRLFRQFTGLGETYFSGNSTGKLLSYMMNDVTAVREAIANSLNQLTNASVLLVTTLIVMSASRIPLQAAGICLLPLLAIPFLVVYFGPRIRKRSGKVQESLAAMTESAEEQFGGVKITKTFAAEDVARRRFGETVDRIRENQLRLVKVTSLFQSALPFSGALSLALALGYGGVMVAHKTMSLGDFVALAFYLKMIVTPLQQIGNVINNFQRARASLERLNRLLSEEPEIREAPGAKPLPPEAGEIEVRDLTFAYPGSETPVLKNVSLCVRPGATLGIVGKTGSGKTTLVKLLLRIYDPPSGTVFIEGRDIRGVTVESLRTNVAYVPQDGFLFSTTIRENIAFHDRRADIADVEEAAKIADVYRNIEAFPDRFETALGERGLTLSGGQRQRTSLARGLFKDAPILILDDSVSAVDTITESTIIRNLRQHRKGRTTLIIAHRISAVRHADEIIVLDEGRIAERGSHEELLKRQGLYASLYAMQGEEEAHG
ncbi:ABC transporter ATP-binding protein [Cohnella caldifontis]|uniref:ABC transporter ATP-binding protein n=1 Tax=Cohnella caldifontis TaxID=3027471 RepID=UPI0023EA9B71|nr:ABC transporter ATP-binding protein [Cohnella sp. YIM B05605]